MFGCSFIRKVKKNVKEDKKYTGIPPSPSYKSKVRPILYLIFSRSSDEGSSSSLLFALLPMQCQRVALKLSEYCKHSKSPLIDQILEAFVFEEPGIHCRQYLVIKEDITKNPAYGRQSISRPMRRVAPIPKKSCQ